LTPLTDLGVLVVGSGPMGLTTAATLLRFGFRDFRIIDAGEGFGEGGRAVNLWARTQEILHAIDVRQELVDRVIYTTGAHLHAYGEYAGFVSFVNSSSPFPAVMSLVQSEVQRGLGRQIASKGVDIEFGTKLVAVRNDSNGFVEAVLETVSGHRETVRTQYLVAADGGRSTVRRLLDIELKPYDIVDARIHQIDARVEGAYPNDPAHWHVFLRPNGQSGIIPIPGGLTRVFVAEAAGDALPDRSATCDEIALKMRDITGDPTFTLSGEVWSSWGTLSAGMTDSFRYGNVLLGGDSGHKIVPVGGQGMNQALHDGHNLGWKIALSAQGRGQYDFLQSYVEERFLARRQLALEQAVSFQRMFAPSEEQIAKTAKLAAEFGAAGEGFTDLPERDQQMLDIAYPDSRLTEGHGTGGIIAGERAPDAQVVDCASERRRRQAHDIFYHGGWTLLAFEGDGGFAARDKIRAKLDVYRQLDQSLVLRAVFKDFDAIAETVANARVLLDLHGSLHNAFEIGSPRFYLVRPDGYVGFCGGLEHADALEAYLSKNVFHAKFKEETRANAA
jgi:3-(3-hydroxy-phenyl)propionate hydroxylase